MKTIGIDLGTTNSLVAIMENGAPKLISNIDSKFLTPSVVGTAKDLELIVVGDSARELAILYPESCTRNFKRLMGLEKTGQASPFIFYLISLMNNFANKSEIH